MSVKRSAPLGRGLAALLGDTVASAGEAIRIVPIEALEPGPFQPRTAFGAETLNELAASIHAQGLLQPILVRPKPATTDRFQIIGGERRWRAAQLIPLHEIGVIVRSLTDRDALAASLVENLQREDLNAIEEAEGYRRLMDEFGLTQDALGAAIGKSRSHVANTLRLLGAPSSIRMMLQAGTLSAGHARALLTSGDAERLADQVVARGLNVRQTEALAARPADQAAPSTPDPAIEHLSQRLTALLGLRVAIRSDGVRGEVGIQFRNLDQLDGLVRLLSGDGKPV